ncbi:sensor histidine kinase [Acetivibrio mesophilus]|uniref:histidine kinase n=1 Tax=Acetivibrio mesophilus TaxID=2487273 RepID=A0A4Q0I3K8_9FIRM|nr:sensor histidine kinase [Acetivibrio mesophilus]RXE58285.1 sensor histidine kinase [Acetivibrio mesophilus]
MSKVIKVPRYIKSVFKKLNMLIIKKQMRFNAAFALIILILTTLLGYLSFNMISNAMINHASADSLELIKQISNNIETIMIGFDDISNGILRNEGFDNLVKMHGQLDNEHKRATNGRNIEDILNTLTKTRTDIADIAVITNIGEYITSGETKPLTTDNALAYYAVRRFKQSKRDSLWIDTYQTEVATTGTHTGNKLVISNMKSIKGENNEEIGILMLNIKESYIYSLISDIKIPDEGQLYIVGKDGNYVMNPLNRIQNGKVDYVKYELYIQEILKQKNGTSIKNINGREYILAYQTIDNINGIELGWTVFGMIPIDVVTSGIDSTRVSLYKIGLICVIIGFGISLLFTRFYNAYLEKSYDKKHSIIMERERLASLGQLMGGIAQNFKTPIMSISEGLDELNNLVVEYEKSIEDGNVSDSMQHEIALRMKKCVDNIKPYCSYISDEISTVKGQAVNFNESTDGSFTVGELLKNVKILMSHEVERHHCEMNVDMKVSEDTSIKGEINNMTQVMNNIITNAIESYNESGGKIDIIFSKKGHNLEINVRDYGCGIPESIKDKLFKEMVTTKGASGTGIGVYMSYSTIKGKFGGTMTIDSEKGMGTSVNISIPLKG